MRPVRVLLLYLAYVFLGGALLAPVLWWLVQRNAGFTPEQLAAPLTPEAKDALNWVQKLARNPFHRYVNRSFLILAVLGLYPLLRTLGANSWAAVGLNCPWKQWRVAAGGWLRGFGWGFVSLALVAAGALLTGARQINPSQPASWWLSHFLNAAAAALLVSILEELLFRGVLHASLRRIHPFLVAALVSSGIYALVHFFSRPPSPTEIHWFSGLQIFAQMLRGFVDFPMLIPGFLNLTLAGLSLAVAFEYSRSLYFSIGLHAGWIFWLKSYAFLSVEKSPSTFWGSSKLIDGWAALLILSVVFFALSRKKNAPATAA